MAILWLLGETPALLLPLECGLEAFHTVPLSELYNSMLIVYLFPSHSTVFYYNFS